MTPAGLGFGANLGDRAGQIAAAMDAVGALVATRVTARSSLYESAPWGEADQPPFLNACALIETGLTAFELLHSVKAMETQLGRTARHRWGPREIDIDILFYGDLALETPALTLPHKYMFERAFVLVPLAEIAPDLEIGGLALRDIAGTVDRTGVNLCHPG